MKFLPSQLLYFFQNRRTQKNIVSLLRFLLSVVAIIAIYSVCFHQIMLLEGRHFSWITGLYWTLTVMSTLGFGDITFHSDLGYLFTIIVLLSGIVLLMVILPFTFIQFFYAPWLEAQEQSRVPRALGREWQGHVILTRLGPITERVIERLARRGIKSVLLVEQWQQAAELSDQGLSVMLGEHDDPATWRNARVEQAALVVATGDDLANTSVAFTVRGITSEVPMVLTADHENSLDILNFPGNAHVFLYHRILGRRLAERTHGLGRPINVVSSWDELVIGEIAARQTGLTGQRLGDILAREGRELPPEKRVQVAGLWQQGSFLTPEMDREIGPRTILLLAGSMEQMEQFEARHALPAQQPQTASVLILGGGRVGRAAAETLHQQAIPFSIVEKRPDVAPLLQVAGERLVTGDAADIAVLERAGIMEVRTVIVTTRNDAMNMYLCFYCRQLRPELQIISRTTLQRSVPKLHMAGADLVLSYASMGANSIINLLGEDEITMFTEGLNLFTRRVPEGLVGRTLGASRIREESGCTVVALRSEEGLVAGPAAASLLHRGVALVLIGDSEAGQRFLEVFAEG